MALFLHMRESVRRLFGINWASRTKLKPTTTLEHLPSDTVVARLHPGLSDGTVTLFLSFEGCVAVIRDATLTQPAVAAELMRVLDRHMTLLDGVAHVVMPITSLFRGVITELRRAPEEIVSAVKFGDLGDGARMIESLQRTLRNEREQASLKAELRRVETRLSQLRAEAGAAAMAVLQA